MATILMTGVTGTVMNPLCARLLEEGHTVVALVRPAKGISPRERLLSALCVNEEAKGRLFVLPGDITQEFAGVSQEDRRFWAGKIDKVLHGAASTKFQESQENRVYTTNVDGTQNMLRLAGKLSIPEFHYVSTAYVTTWTKEGEETKRVSGEFRNVYEDSKALAEKKVHQFQGKISIYRIPIVVGDSQTGEIRGFSGYYGFLALFWQLSQSLRKKWVEDPSGLQQQDITMDEEGYLHVPLAVPCSLGGPLNLVSLDWLTDMFLRLVEMQADGAIYHLTHPNPRGVRETMVTSLACLGLRGIACGEYPDGNKPGLLGRIQKGILKNIKPYWLYISEDREWFDDTIAVQTLGQAWREPPDIDPIVMGRLLDFAKSKNFGRASGE